MLRSRRGQRLGLDEDGDDELAAMLGTHVPAAHPRDGQDFTDEPAYAEDAETPAEAPRPAGAPSPGSKHLRSIPFLSLAPSLQPSEHDEASPVGIGEVSTETREITLSGSPSLRQSAANNGVDLTPPAKPVPAPPAMKPQPAPPAADPGPSDSEVAARLERKASTKPKRSSVPSWDEIVFGTKGD